VFHSDFRGADYFNNFLYEIEFLKDNKIDLSELTYHRK
jgi:hypothetical protein